MNHLGPAERFVAGALGEPGRRTFYVEVTAEGTTHWYLLEKPQVSLLGTQALQLLAEAGIAPDPEAVDRLLASGLQVDEPGDVSFRVGTMSLRLDAASEMVTVALHPEDDQDEGVSFVVAPEQLRAMALKAIEAVAAGRPICPRCRLPENPDGHECPAVNGHRRR